MISLTEDKLNRNEFLKDIFNLFDNFGNYGEGGLTISINGKYGSGKSTLLNFIEQKNQDKQKYHIIKYDAWQNNLFDNPLIPLLYTLNTLESTGSKIREGAKKILKAIPKVFTRTLANAHSVDLSPLFCNKNIFEEYTKYNQAVNKYRNILTELCKNKKVILLIDELDRCLPEYQIKVLETLYNIFNVPDLILVIAIDKRQLEYTIKKIFGNKEDVSGYLAKFIQYEIDLPETGKNKYLQTLIKFQCQYPEIKKICANMFDIAKISIRNCLQIVKELNLICNENDGNGKQIQYYYWYPLFVCLVIIIKKQYREIYKKYFYDEITEETSGGVVDLNKTRYYEFLSDIEGTSIKDIISYFISKKMNFAFILYFINYFHSLRKIDMSSLYKYTNYQSSRIEGVINSFEIPMWSRIQFNDVLSKIRIFK